ncbi:tigger transposable element-derived protein 4-like [Calliphora vicina]|uniref:tigger transposable element-derived protein 4-like n=2 Tax=Calliphora vicina TaxID=7373 RepID=UPI00325AA1DA
MPKAVLSIKEKVNVIEIHKNEKLSVRELAKKCKISKTQAACIVKNKDQILKLWDTNVNPERKKSMLSPKGLCIDKLCYEWFVKARNKAIPLSGTLIRSKAKEIAENMNFADFSASSGWLERFKKRHNISFRTISGEAASVNQNDVINFTEKVPSLIEGYDSRDIYNADETGLFFRALPDKTFALKGETCAGGKMAKDRLTILHCANMAGEKERLFVIGKAAKPRAFRNINLTNLPVTWRSNKKAWMTSELMTDFLVQFDRKMQIQERKVLLFLDNATSHPRDLKLKNVKVIFSHQTQQLFVNH